LREGCAPLEWHEYHFPNCNEVSECIDVLISKHLLYRLT
jgi:hypothetical protein